MIRRSTLIFFEIFVGLFVTAGLGLALVAWRLSQGPIEFPPIKRQIEAQLSQARQGRPVSIGRIEIAWAGVERGLQVRALDVRALDDDGVTLTTSRSVDIGVDPMALLVGRLAVAQASFDGVDLAATMLPDGGVHLAFGPPGAPPDVVIPPPPDDETLSQRVNRMLDGMQDAFRPVGLGGALRRLEVRNSRLTIVDGKSGDIWRASDAGLLLTREGETLRLTAAAGLKGRKGAAPTSIEILSDTTFQTATIVFDARGLHPSALLVNGELGLVSALDAPVDAAITLGLDRTLGVTRLEGDIEIGKGVFRGLGGEVRLDRARLHGQYDIDTDILSVEDVEVGGVATRINGEALIKGASALFGAADKPPAMFSMDVPTLELEAPGVFPEKIALRDVTARGALDLTGREVSIQTLAAKVDQAALELSGRVYWAPANEARRSPGLDVAGRLVGDMQARTILPFWPKTLAVKSREWVAENVQSGRLGNVTLAAAIVPGEITAGKLRNEALSLKFDFTDAHVRYVPDMTAITNGRGSAELKGNRFDLALASGSVGALTLSNGVVQMPVLRPKPAPATYGARIEGDARSMIDLLLQAPIGLEKTLPVAPETVLGSGSVTFSMQRPMGSDVDPLSIKFTVDGAIAGAGAVLKEDARYRVSDWSLRLRGDERALTFSGPMKLGRSEATLTWTELLRDGGDAPSSYVIDGRFDASHLVSLGYGVAAFADGPIGVQVRGRGKGATIARADVDLNLKDAEMALPGNAWSKRPGRPGSVSFAVAGTARGGLLISGLDARGPGLAAKGQLTIGPDQLVQTANLERVWIEGRTDLKAEARRDSAGVLHVIATGPRFDAAPFVGGGSQPPASEKLVKPNTNSTERIKAGIIAERILLRGDVELTGGRVETAFDGALMTRLSVRGASQSGKGFVLELGGPDFAPTGPIAFQADDLGVAVRGITGAENVRGGVVSARGSWRVADQRADVVVKAQDFSVMGVPAVARLFTSMGSITGAVEMLNGDGISFTGLEAPVVVAGDKVYVSESRAAGPSIGVTAKGSVGLKDGELDIDGVLVPSYGLNSLLGGLPVFGQLLTSRPGEGVVGMTYSINGPSDAPRVGVNPLSALTPGIFRRLFDPWSPPETAPPPEAAEGPSAAKG